MSVKTTVAEYVMFSEDDAFWQNGWHEDVVILINGGDENEKTSEELLMKFNQSDELIIQGGTLFRPNSVDGIESEPRATSFEAEFRRWRKRQRVKIVSVEIPTELLSDLDEFLEQHGGRRIK